MVRSILLGAMLVSGLSYAANDKRLQLSQPALDFFNVWLGYYEGVIKFEHLSEDTGLSGVFHGMFVDRAQKISEDPSAQAAAVVIYNKMQSDSTVALLLAVLAEGCDQETGKSIADQIKVLAQKDGVLASSQMGFTLEVPEGDLNAVFGQDSNVALAKELFVRNAGYPNTPEAVAVVRGGAIANCYLSQELQLLHKDYFSDSMPLK